jgi:hypothetical protein
MRLLPIIICGLCLASGLVNAAESSDSSESPASEISKAETQNPNSSATTAPADQKSQGAPQEKLPEPPKSLADQCRDRPC